MKRLWSVMWLLSACGTANDAIPCVSTSQCDLHSGGLCLTGPGGRQWCRYNDPACPSGTRWSEQSGDGLAGVCYEQSLFDAGPDSRPLIDAGPQADGGVDTTPPTTTITSKPGAISGGSVTFIFESNEDGTFECDLDNGGFAACDNPKAYSLATGPHTFSVRATDTAGNVDPSPEVYAWQVDTGILDTTITAAPGSTSGRNVTFQFTATRPGTFQCKLAPIDAAFAACSSPKMYTNLVDTQNPHAFSVRAVDTGSNVDDTPATVTWSVDSTGPVVNIASPGPRSNATPSFIFNTEPGASYTCRIDSSTAFACTSGATSPALSQGSHVVYVAGTDAFGNQGAEANKGFTVDTTKPTFPTFDGPTEGGTSYRSTSFSFSATDNSGLSPSVSCLLDGAPPAGGCSSPRMFSGLSFGAHTFSVTATDDVGNSEAISRSWFVTPVLNGQLANIVVGQPDFTSTDIQSTPNAQEFRPTSVGWDGQRFFISDVDHLRIMVFGVPPSGPPMPSGTWVLGQPDFMTVNPIGGQSGFQLLGTLVSGVPGTLAVSDRVRVLLFNTTSGISNQMNASLVLGQPDYDTYNRGSGANQFQFTVGVWTDGNRVLVADPDNMRVQIWTTRPTVNGQAASLSLGAASPAMIGDGSIYPLGVSSDGLRIFVAGGKHVWIWNQFPTISGAPPDIVVGQEGCSTPSETCIGGAGSVVVAAGNMFVVDGGYKRVLVWSPTPTASGTRATAVLGQDGFDTMLAGPSQKRFVSPETAVVVGTELYVSDFNGYRVLGFQLTLN